jgi:hypothetical protein
MADLEDIGLLGRQTSGQTSCKSCGTRYNNRAVPPICDVCKTRIGGTYVPKKKTPDPHLITSSLASVRTNTAGVPIRTFVDLSLQKVNKPNFSFKKYKIVT